MVKEAIRSSGANATEKHVEDVSLSALFLMDAAKKADHAFGITPQSSAHTVRSVENDIHKMVQHLMQKKVTSHVSSRSDSPFTDPTVKGWEKLSTSDWIRETIMKTHSDGDLENENERSNDELDLNYEICDVV